MQHSFQVWQRFINVLKFFSYKNSLLILSIQGKKNRMYLITNWLTYFGEFSNPTRKIKERQQEFSCFEKII